MSVIHFQMREHYKEQKDDILLAYNENKPKEQQFEDISEWERKAIRNYLAIFIQVYRKWQQDKQITNPMTQKVVDADVKFDVETIQLQSKSKGIRPFQRALTLGDKTITWLKTGAAYNNALQEYLCKINNTKLTVVADSVQAAIEQILDDAVWRAMSEQDAKELDEEEKYVKEQLNKEALEVAKVEQKTSKK